MHLIGLTSFQGEFEQISVNAESGFLAGMSERLKGDGVHQQHLQQHKSREESSKDCREWFKKSCFLFIKLNLVKAKGIGLFCEALHRELSLVCMSV